MPLRTDTGSLTIFRGDNLGDLILFSGALRHIRRHSPRARITMCVKRYALDYLRLCPHVDRLVCWEDLPPRVKSSGKFMTVPDDRPAWRTRSRRYLAERRCRADTLLLPVRSPSLEMHCVLEAIPAREKYGIAGDLCNQAPEHDRAFGPAYTSRLELPAERSRDPEISVTRDFLSFLGVDVGADDLWPEVWTDAADRRWAEERVPRAGPALTLAVCPGVLSAPGKAYPAASFGAAVAAIDGARFDVVILGTRADAAACSEIARALANCSNVASVTDLAGQSTIGQMVEAVRRSDALLAVDAAPLHVGVALRKPTVGILGGGHFGRFYPWGDPALNRVAHLPLDCYWCNWDCRYPTTRCVREIPAETVARELAEALRFARPGSSS